MRKLDVEDRNAASRHVMLAVKCYFTWCRRQFNCFWELSDLKILFWQKNVKNKTRLFETWYENQLYIKTINKCRPSENDIGFWRCNFVGPIIFGDFVNLIIEVVRDQIFHGVRSGAKPPVRWWDQETNSFNLGQGRTLFK